MDALICIIRVCTLMILLMEKWVCVFCIASFLTYILRVCAEYFADTAYIPIPSQSILHHFNAGRMSILSEWFDIFPFYAQ